MQKSGGKLKALGFEDIQGSSQAAAVVDTWYELVNISGSGVLKYLVVRITTTGEDIQVGITVDGQTEMDGGSQAQVANQWNYFYASPTGNTHGRDTSVVMFGFYAGLEFDASVVVRVKKTTAAGAGTIEARARISKRG